VAVVGGAVMVFIAAIQDGNGCATAESRDWRGYRAGGPAALPTARGEGAQNEGPSGRALARRASARRSYDLVAGLTPGLSLKNFLFRSVKLFH
jgi:hypothetical protein